MKFAENVATIEGNAVFEETVKMSVENKSISHIIRSLTDTYSNPMLAVSREYVSNAYDAVISRMGVESSFGTVLDTPIEVTLPSTLNPNFVVRDYGTGMDKETLTKVFPKYGASTKRKNNNEIGGFGLGAKSALSIFANFTVVTVKNGKKNTAIIQKGEDGVGELSLLPEMETEEVSGTTITINVPNSYELNKHFRDSTLLLGFPHGSILLNGQMHENSVFNPDLYTKVSEDGYVSNSLLSRDDTSYYRGYREQIVVVGPISYRVKESDLRGEDSSDAIFGPATPYSVLTLPIGSVDFIPSRENLIFSDRTRKAVIDAAKRLYAEIDKFAQKSLEESPNKVVAVRRASRLRGNGFTLDFTYKGEEIPRMSLAPFFVEDKKAWLTSQHSRSTPHELGNAQDFTHHYSINTVVVTGVEDAVKAKFLNRLRKPFAERYNPAKVNSHSLTVLFTQAEKSELTSWADALVMEVMTADEWEAKGVEFRRQINEEKKARRAANGFSTAPSVGSLPISVIQASSYYSTHDRPKVYAAAASEVASADTVVYIRVNKSAVDTMTHKFAKTMSENNEALSVSGMNSGIKAVEGHYSKDGKKVRIVRIPSGTKVETFLKAVPHAISMDDALKAVAKEIVSNKEDAIAMLIAKKSAPFMWLEVMSQSWIDKIENEEVRAFVKTAREAYRVTDDVKTARAINAKSNFIFAPGFDFLFSDFRAEVKASNKYKLPLLNHVQTYNLDSEAVVQYINLMYPKAA